MVRSNKKKNSLKKVNSNKNLSDSNTMEITCSELMEQYFI